MTLSALRNELLAIRAHDLAETNVEAVELAGGSVLLAATDRDADLVADLQANVDTLAADLKECEAERDGLVAELERVTEAQVCAADMAAEIERFREHAAQWAEAHEAMQREVTALRKRKGRAAGVCAYSNDVWTLLCYVAQDKGRYADDARRLVDKINSL